MTQHLKRRSADVRVRANVISKSLPIGVVSVCAIVVVIYASAGGVKDQFDHTSLTELHAPRSKFVAWRSATTLIDESPWVGIGRGAFEPVFQRVHPASAYATYTHLENEYLQAVVDWGVPGALVLAFVTIWLFVVAERRWQDGPLVAGSFGALAAVMLQSNVDFGLEFLGLAAPCTAIAATLSYVPLRDASPRRLTMMRFVRVSHVLGLGLAALLLSTSVTTSLAEDHEMLKRDPSNAVDAIARHPFDYYAYARRAESALHSNDASAVPLLNHALLLHPTEPGLHLAAARMLYNAHHPQQAAIEYATAFTAARDPRRLLTEISQRFAPDVAASALPTDLERVDSVLQMLSEVKRDDIALAWLQRIVLLTPGDFHACESLFRMAIQLSKLDVVDTMRRRCARYQLSEADRIALARVLEAKHDEAAVVSTLADVETWQGRSDEKLDAWQRLCEAELELSRFDDAKRCWRRLEGSTTISSDLESEIVDALDRVEQARRASVTSNGDSR